MRQQRKAGLKHRHDVGSPGAVMKNQGLFTSIAAVTILLGGLLPAALGRSTAYKAEAAAQQRPPAAPARTSASDASDDLDALDTLAESLGLDVSPDGLKDTIRQDVAWLHRADDPAAPAPAAAVARERQQTAFAHLTAFFALPIRDIAPPGLADARGALTQLSDALNTETPPKPATLAKLDRFIAAYFNDDALRVANPSADARLLATDFDTIDRSPLKLAMLHRSAEEQHISVRFMIATLPDPVDSFTGWQFDPMLDAVAQAVAASDFVLDRFHFPDSDFESSQAGSAQSRSERAHDSTPGVIVFRSHVAEDISLDTPSRPDAPDSRARRNAGSDRLVLLVVHENPSGGVHVPALTGAIRLILEWTDPDRIVRILGPTFSGSTDSIARTLRQLEPELPEGYWFRIISGSATNPATRSTLDGSLNERVQFRATVNSDDVLFQKLFEHLSDLDWPKPIAVLFEANTLYGRGMVEQIVEHQQLIDRQQLVLLPFPMNISRLRSAAPAASAESDNALRLPSRFRPLSLQDMERANPVDRLPQFFPDTASNYQELALSSSLQAIAQEHIRTVALMATDPRDKLFLAQQLARYAPDISIVTPESDSLYVHPDYASYLRGALVVSTYPLDPGNQRRSYGFEGSTSRRQFANGSAQGIYNATIILLNYDEAGAYHYTAGLSRHLPAKLVEYGPPLKECNPCSPPVWISVIGPNGAAPLRAYEGPAPQFRCAGAGASARVQPANTNCEADSYVLPILSSVDAEQREPGFVASGSPMTFPSLSFRVVFLGLALLVLGTWVAFVISGTRTTWLSRQALNRYSGGYLLVSFGGLLLIATFIVTTLVVRLRAEPSGLTRLAFAGALVAIVALVDLSRRASTQFLGGGAVATKRPAGILPVRLIGIPLAALGAFAVANLLRYEWREAMAPPSDSINFVARAVDLASGLSPTLPVACLGLGVVLWALSEFARSRTPGIALTDESVRPLLKHAVRGDIEALTRTPMLLNGSLLSVPAPLLAAVLVSIVLVSTFAFDPIALPLVTVEGPAFSRFISAALLAFQLLIGLSLCQFIYVWLSLKTLLRGMGHHELSRAYGRVRRALRPVGFFPRIPELQTLHPIVTRWQQYSNANPADRFAMRPGPIVMEVFEKEMREAPATPWSVSLTWKALMKDIRLLAGERAVMPAELGAPAFMASSEATSLPRELDDIVAISVALVVRDAIARLWHNLVFIAGAVSLVFASHTFFPVQPQKTLAAIAWVYVCTTFAAILTVLVQMKRDHVLARLMCVASDQRRWDADVILKFAIFGALPLLTLFATQFPDTGGVLLRWLEPVQKALP